MTDVKATLRDLLNKGRRMLLPHEAYALLSNFNISVVPHKLVTNVMEAVEAAERMGYPVVLKVVSPDVVHKTDVGGVMLNIEGSAQLKRSYEDLLSNVRRNAPEARIFGILVEKMMPKSIEVMIGGMRDSTFGPIVAFGLGGIFVEALGDVAFAVAPINKCEAVKLVKKVRGYRVLSGLRGRPLDVDSVVEIVVKVSKILVELPEIAELDLNPIFVYERGSTVIDARVILGHVPQ